MGRRNLTLNDAHNLVLADPGREKSGTVENGDIGGAAGHPAAPQPAMVAYAEDLSTSKAHTINPVIRRRRAAYP
jgi:hypothetical protein